MRKMLQRRGELAVLLAAQDLHELVSGEHELAHHGHQVFQQIDVDADALTGNRRFFSCLDLPNGKSKWVFHDAYSPQERCVTCASPAVSEGRVYFGGRDGFAYAVEAQSGKLIWKKDLGADVTTSAAVDHHNLYLGTSKRHLYRLNTDSGAVLSDLPTESAPNRRLIIANDSLLVFLGDEIFASFDLDLKKLRWSAEASKQWTSARPYLWRDAVLAGNRRELIALRSSDGTREWSFQFPETVRGIGTSPDILYIGTLAGSVFAYFRKP